MKSFKFTHLVIGLTGFFLASCSLFRKADETGPNGKQVNQRTAYSMLESMPDTIPWMEAKYQIKLESEKFSQNGRITLRLAHDKAIWLSVSPGFGIEVARLYMTPDSVIFLNKLNRTYYKGRSQELGARLGIPLDFYLVQDLFEARPANFYSTDLPHLFFDSLGRWTLSNLEREEFLEAVKPGSEEENLTAFGLDALNQRLLTQYSRKGKERFVEVVYTGYEEDVSKGAIPETFEVNLQGKEKAKLWFTLQKLDLENRKSMNIRIPSSYAPM
mgnify:CR=1 FL=1